MATDSHRDWQNMSRFIHVLCFHICPFQALAQTHVAVTLLALCQIRDATHSHSSANARSLPRRSLPVCQQVVPRKRNRRVTCCTCLLLQPYVEGRECSRCQAGYFYLHSDNAQGCLSCYCMGVTDQCTNSRYYRSKVSMQILLPSYHKAQKCLLFFLSFMCCASTSYARMNEFSSPVTANCVSLHFTGHTFFLISRSRQI